MRIHFFIATFAVALAGCGTMHVPPTTGPTAKLRVITLNSNQYFTWNRDASSTCSRDSPNFAMLGGDAKPDQVVVGMPGNEGAREGRFERVIKADAPMRFWQSTLRAMGVGEAILSQTNVVSAAHARSNAWSCGVVTEFVPESGKNYELVSDFAPGRCVVTVAEFSLAADGKVTKKPVPIKITGGPEQTDVCSKLAK